MGKSGQRILFIQENAISEILGFCSLSAYLKKHGHYCDLLLLTHTSNWLDTIRSFSPDLIGFSIFTGMQHSIYELVKQIKQHFDIPVIAGGPHPTYYPNECMIECPEIDMICRGEGEISLLQLVEALENNEDYTHIPGIWVRKKQEIIKNGIAPLIQDLNSLPLPDRNIYFKYRFLKTFPAKRFMSGYGCPYNCSFCNHPFFRKEYLRYFSHGTFIRRKNVDYVIKEIMAVKNTSRMKLVHFSDDFFFPSGDWMTEFSEKFPATIGLPFSCTLRFDSLNEESVKLLKKAGCWGVQIGIESGSARLRNKVIGKQLTYEDIIKGAELLRKYNIKMYSTNIIGLPSETFDEALQTVELNRKIKVNFARINTWMAFPNTDLSEYAISNGYLPKDYSLKDLNTDDSLHIQSQTPFANNFKNIACLFCVLVKFPFIMPFARLILKLKNNALFRMCGILNLIQDVRFLKIDFFSGLRFYLNTLHKAEKGQSIHWWPGIKGK